MPTPNHVEEQINKLLSRLMEKGLIDDQNFVFQRTAKKRHKEITFKGAEHIQVALRDEPYKEIYRHLAQKRAYNAKMLDGALLQMMYTFDGDILQRHRLAFFSAPHLEEFQNNPDIYLEDEIYADVIAKSIVPFPLRFDYDIRNQEQTHPKSHLSLGQYKDCRIPVSSPLTPFWFVNFILRNFYHTASSQYIADLPARDQRFPKSINSKEQNTIHVIVPA